MKRVFIETVPPLVSKDDQGRMTLVDPELPEHWIVRQFIGKPYEFASIRITPADAFIAAELLRRKGVQQVRDVEGWGSLGRDFLSLEEFLERLALWCMRQ